MPDFERSGLSRRCAEYVAGLRHSYLNEGVRNIARKCFMDWMGCVLGGASTPEGAIVRQFSKATGGDGSSTVFGDSDRAGILNACFVNGCEGHVLEMDDVHQASVLHPGVVVISAAFALAESLHASGNTMLDGITAGYDIMVRMGEAAGPTHYETWHSTATCGAFGAAAASARILGLSPEQTLWAIGNAGSQAAGLWEFAADGSMTKILHCGKAAMNGVMAALLASYGFTGASRIIEGPRGFLRATSKAPSLEPFEDLGKRFAILETAFKPYASCRHTHSFVDAIIRIRNRFEGALPSIRKIMIETYPTALNVAGANRYDTPAKAKFNMRYCAARALLDGSLGVRGFAANGLKDPAIASLVEKIQVSVNPDLEAMYPERWAAHVTVQTETDILHEFVEFPSGDPRNPISQEALERKFMDLACLSVSKQSAEDLLYRCRTVFESPDVASHFSTNTNERVRVARF